MYSNRQVLTYVKDLKYLGHIITEAFKDNDDIERERRNVTVQGNIFICTFAYCSDGVKRLSLPTYCMVWV